MKSLIPLRTKVAMGVLYSNSNPGYMPITPNKAFITEKNAISARYGDVETKISRNTIFFKKNLFFCKGNNESKNKNEKDWKEKIFQTYEIRKNSSALRHTKRISHQIAVIPNKNHLKWSKMHINHSQL